MGFFDFLKKKSTRYAVIIGVIATMAGAELNYKSRDEALQISELGAKVENSLRQNQVNKKDLKRFVDLIIKNDQRLLDRKNYLKNDVMPQQMYSATMALNEFYREYDTAIDILEKEQTTFALSDWGKRNKLFQCLGFANEALADAEEALGIRLDNERKDLKELYRSAIEKLNKKIQEYTAARPQRMGECVSLEQTIEQLNKELNDLDSGKLQKRK